MKKFILVLIVFTLFASFVYADLLTRGELRTRMALYYEIGKDMPTQSFIDSRFQMTFEKAFSNYLTAVWKVQVGDLVWGQGGAGFPAGEVNIETRNLYLGFLCPLTGVNAKLGIQEWKDPRSLVLDDDQAPFAGIMINKMFGEDIMLEFGTAKLYEGEIDYDDDIDLFFINFDKGKMFGLNNIIRRWNAGNNIDAWIMPYFNYMFDGFDINLLAAYNMASYSEWIPTEDGWKDYSNGGFAVSLKAGYDFEVAMVGLDFLYTSGDDESDPESTTIFNSIHPYYKNGLEIFGIGIHSGASAGYVEPGNDGQGLMSIVLNGAYPVNDELTLKAAFGMLNAVEADETDMGMEVNLGMNYKLYQNLHFDLVGAMAMPGKYYGDDVDNTMALVSRFMYRF
ncbi:MAG: hypothetical protein K0B81_01730 [Candidatus Cloacimonetes bacterium]|nr:hypothetical protein [Candidatus Cloacimonadota bacterium]